MKKIIINVLLFSFLLIPVYADHVIYINDEEDFIKFANNCQLDSYSKDKKFILNTDLDFSSYEFKSIPIFYGTFDGTGHSIKGVHINASGSKLGLFRINSGRVVNLRVDAYVHPSGTAKSLGILVGENRGRINNCTVFGMVKGKTDIGGVVGVNTSSGIITSSSSKATVIGTLHSGGIAGFNEGEIKKCLNEGMVNTAENQVNKNKILSLEDIRYEFLGDKKDSTTDVFSCVGGIVGRNEGLIISSSNTSDIGYIHLGDNIGGIAGIQSGVITNSYNSGKVVGRRDIGGIVGQFEPDIDMKYGKDQANKLRNEFDHLSMLFKEFNKELEVTENEAINRSTTINNSIKKIEDNFKNIATNVNEFSKIKVDGIYDSVELINKTNDEMIDEFKKYSTLILDDSKKALDYIDPIIDDVVQIIDDTNQSISDANDSIANSRDVLVIQKNRLLALKDNFKNINDTVKKYTLEVETQILLINKNIEELNDLVKNITTINDMMNNFPEINKRLKNLLDIASNLAQISNNILKESTDDVDVIIDTTFSAIDIISNEVTALNNELNENISTVTASNDKALSRISNNKKELETVLYRMQDNIKILNDEMNKRFDINNDELHKIEDLVKKEFDYVNDSLHSSYDDIYVELDTIYTNFDKILVNEKENLNQVHDIADDIVDSFNTIGNIIQDITKKPEYSYKVIYDYKKGELKKGTISFCINDGIINGDMNVGGISGMNNFEIGNDPKIKFLEEQSIWRDTKANLRATIYASKNNGTIKTKNDYAGGITGMSAIGTIYKAVNKGNIEGKNYLGGIAGYSESDIIESNVLCDIKGNSNIGGVGGLVHNISNNNCMVRITYDGEKIGAIAGSIKDDAEIINNKFVNENIGAIDGISYENKAYPLTYEEFINIKDMPNYYNTLFVRFYDGDRLVKTVNIKYGGTIDENQVPSTTTTKDMYTEWQEFNKKNIIRSKDVYLEYKPWIQTISSGESVPLLLVEGKFLPTDELVLHEIDYRLVDDEKYTESRTYNYELKNTDIFKEDIYVFRAKLYEEEELKYIEDGKMKDITYTMDGNYAIFKAPKKGTIIILKKYVFNYYIFLPFIVLIVIIIILVKKIKSIKKKKRKKAAKQIEEKK